MSPPLQFANGSKGFLIPSTPDLFVYATGGGHDEKGMSKEALTETFTAGIEGGDTGWEEPEFDDSTESVFTEQGVMRISGYNLKSSVYYAVTGGPGGQGCMLIHPQDPQLSQNNSSAATALINFLGGLTPDQSGAGAQGQVTNPEGSQYAIQSIAAVSLRITFDFGAGTSTVDAIMQINQTEEGEDAPIEPKPTVRLHVGPKAFFARPA